MWVCEETNMYLTQPTPYKDGCTQLLSCMDARDANYMRNQSSRSIIGWPFIQLESMIFSGCIPNLNLYKINNYFELLKKSNTKNSLKKSQHTSQCTLDTLAAA
jgi:hypothetical protein